MLANATQHIKSTRYRPLYFDKNTTSKRAPSHLEETRSRRQNSTFDFLKERERCLDLESRRTKDFPKCSHDLFVGRLSSGLPVMQVYRCCCENWITDLKTYEHRNTDRQTNVCRERSTLPYTAALHLLDQWNFHQDSSKVF